MLEYGINSQLKFRQYKEEAAEALEVPTNTPIDEMLDLFKERYRLFFDWPESKRERALLLFSIACRKPSLIRR